MKRLLSELKLTFYLVISLILFHIITIILHELGHYLVAEILGYNASLHYNSTTVDSWNTGREVSDNHSFWITLGGSIQTLIFGILGLRLLYKHKRAFKKAHNLKPRQWAFVFLATTPISYSVNFFIWMIIYSSPFTLNVKPDEITMAECLNIPTDLILLVFGILGIVAVRYTIKHFIPNNFKSIFLFSLIIGYFLFFLVWLGVLGPWLLP